ncbi:MAG: iron-containing alcohol dehydrogenase [Spirochaetaceae bacterium]|nr:iron-containing alcohol dehydrogenase [Spirochaetaceae bacterium]
MIFSYFTPTRIFAGEGALGANAACLRELGGKALVVTGRASAAQNGSLADVRAALEQNEQDFILYNQVTANPTVECCYDAAAVARREHCDCIIAIGGGSPLDAGKAAALLAVEDTPPEELFTTPPRRALPIAAVPTTAGTGSEVTPVAVLTNHAERTKTSISAPVLFPRLAFLDARYTNSLSRATAVNTAIDALTHAAEGMLSVRASAFSDTLAKASLGMIADCADALSRGDFDGAVREKLLFASTLAGMVIANTGTTAVHSAGYSLTYFKHIDHGRANGLLFSAYLRFVDGHERGLPIRRAEEVCAALRFAGFDELDVFLDGLLGEREKLSAVEIAEFSGLAENTRGVKNSRVSPSRADIARIFAESFPA